MKQVEVAIVGTGWCGGIRAETCAQYPAVSAVHVAEIRPDRLAEIAKITGARTATTDYRELVRDPAIEVVLVCATPETTHYPIARDALAAGKHVLLEKPIALTFDEADDLIDLARKNNLKFTIGYSQRFNPKFAYVKKALEDGTVGRPVSVLVSRNITRSLGKRSAAASSFRPRRWKRRTISISSCGVSNRGVRFASTRKRRSVRCGRRAVPASPTQCG